MRHFVVTELVRARHSDCFSAEIFFPAIFIFHECFTIQCYSSTDIHNKISELKTYLADIFEDNLNQSIEFLGEKKNLL